MWEARRDAVGRGLRACGFDVDDTVHDYSKRWPTWAWEVYFSFPASLEVVAVRVLAEGPPEERDAVEAAYALGGSRAVHEMLRERVVRAHRGEAQGELAGGSSAPEEKET